MADDYQKGVNECIHLIHPHPDGKLGRKAFRQGIVNAPGGSHDIACKPGSTILPTMATCQTVAVTCPLCKASDIFKKLDAVQNSGFGGPAGISEADQCIIDHLAATATK